ncbi:MAG TPA: TetR family transcriptional regulator, partial [Pseudomonadales bacterium]|nr:TetR family transcriptional regulator [Pseudomonadales bacterium]
MANHSTVDRILDTAEQLFAEKGFTETSLRMITSRAGVNLAAVNYHFGSKEALIQAVFARFLSPYCEQLDIEFERLQKTPHSLERLLSIVARIGVKQFVEDPARGAIWMRLIGLAYTQAQGHLRKYIRERYGAVFRKFIALLKPACPGLSSEDLYWRTQFALGSAVFTFSNIEILLQLTEHD